MCIIHTLFYQKKLPISYLWLKVILTFVENFLIEIDTCLGKNDAEKQQKQLKTEIIPTMILELGVTNRWTP